MTPIEAIKRVMDEVEDSGLPDSAYWTEVHRRLGLKYGDVFDVIEQHLEYFDGYRASRKEEG